MVWRLRGAATMEVWQPQLQCRSLSFSRQLEYKGTLSVIERPERPGRSDAPSEQLQTAACSIHRQGRVRT